MKILSWRRV